MPKDAGANKDHEVGAYDRETTLKQRVWHVGTQVCFWAFGVALVVLGGTLEAKLGKPGAAVLLTLGATVLSAVAVGTLLNVVWWEKWTRKALANLFQDPDLITSLGLDRGRLRERLLRVICAVYGSRESLPHLRRLLDEDVLDRLGYPLRKDYRVLVRLRKTQTQGYTLMKQTLTICYALHYSTPESHEHSPFPENIILRGYVDIPDVLLDVWRQRLSQNGISDESAEGARKLLQQTIDQVSIFELGSVLVNGQELPGSDMKLDVVLDGTKPEPSLAYTLLYQGKGLRIMEGKEEVDIQYEHTVLHNLYSYSMFTISGLTDSFIAHISYDPEECKTALRYFLPNYWRSGDLLRRNNTKTGEIDMSVTRMLMAGHGILWSWGPQALPLPTQAPQPASAQVDSPPTAPVNSPPEA